MGTLSPPSVSEGIQSATGHHTSDSYHSTVSTMRKQAVKTQEPRCQPTLLNRSECFSSVSERKIRLSTRSLGYCQLFTQHRKLLCFYPQQERECFTLCRREIKLRSSKAECKNYLLSQRSLVRILTFKQGLRIESKTHGNHKVRIDHGQSS